MDGLMVRGALPTATPVVAGDRRPVVDTDAHGRPSRFQQQLPIHQPYSCVRVSTDHWVLRKSSNHALRTLPFLRANRVKRRGIRPCQWCPEGCPISGRVGRGKLALSEKVRDGRLRQAYFVPVPTTPHLEFLYRKFEPEGRKIAR